MVYSGFEIIRDSATFCHNIEDFLIFVAFNRLGSEVANQISHTVDIIRQTDAANHFHKNKADSFLIISGGKVPEPYR